LRFRITHLFVLELLRSRGTEEENGVPPKEVRTL